MKREVHTLALEGREVHYTLERKAVKNLNLRVREDGIFVSAPSGVPLPEIEAFLRNKADFLRRAEAHLAGRSAQKPPELHYLPGEHVLLLGEDVTLALEKGRRRARLEGTQLTLCLPAPEDEGARRRLFEEFWRNKALLVFCAAIEEQWPAFADSGPMPELHLYIMRRCWGLCRPQSRRITLNPHLLGAPPRCIDFVVVHELCHLLETNHTPRFYELLDAHLPDWRAREEELNALAGRLLQN